MFKVEIRRRILKKDMMIWQYYIDDRYKDHSQAIINTKQWIMLSTITFHFFWLDVIFYVKYSENIIRILYYSLYYIDDWKHIWNEITTFVHIWISSASDFILNRGNKLQWVQIFYFIYYLATLQAYNTRSPCTFSIVLKITVKKKFQTVSSF